MKERVAQREKVSHVIESNSKTRLQMPMEAILRQYSEKNNLIQRRTLAKDGAAEFTVVVPTDGTHWIVPSPLAVIKDRKGKINGLQFNGANEITKLKPRTAHQGQMGINYAAKHHGGRAAGGISGTPCHVYKDRTQTNYCLTIPHYHACTKNMALTAAEANGAAAVAGVNDGMHLHAEQDVTKIQEQLNGLADDVIRAGGEKRIDTSPGIIP